MALWILGVWDGMNQPQEVAVRKKSRMRKFHL